MYDLLISNPDRATDIAFVATEWQDGAVQRLDALPPESAAPPESSDVGKESPSDLEHGTARSARKNRKDPSKAKKRKHESAGAAADVAPEAAEPGEPALFVEK